jgi:hypothetical protein
MTNSVAIIENMMYAFILLVVSNVLISFHILDSCVSLFSKWGVLSSFDVVTLFFKYQRSLDHALRAAPASIPLVSATFQLLKFSLEVYLRRISEVTIVCITPTLLFNLKGNFAHCCILC